MAEDSQNPDPLSRTLYPFPGQDNSDPAQPRTAEVGAQEYFQALAQAEDGFFPIGYNGQWHGGIHFGTDTGRTLVQDDGIRCIAKGQVIAYRIDEDYPTVKYETCAPATYSTGFVLVRHRLQLPPAPQTNAQDEDAGDLEEAGSLDPQPQTEPSLVLYSLYMHLLNWKAYEEDTELKRPAFWGNSTYLVGDRAIDTRTNENSSGSAPTATGMNIRDANNVLVGFAPRGVKLKLGEPNLARTTYYQILEVVAGTTEPADVAGMYIYKGTATSKEGLDPLSEPEAKGRIHILADPVDIVAGDLIGHLGQYQRYLDMEAMAACDSHRPLAQVDVFTPENLQDFIDQGRARDAQLESSQKTLLHIKPGARLVQPDAADIDLPAGEAAILAGDDASGHWVKGLRGTIGTVDRSTLGSITMATRTYPDGSLFISAVRPSDGSELTLEQYNALATAEQAAYSQRKVLVPAAGDIWLDRSAANEFNVVQGPARAWSRFPLQVANAGGEAVAHARVIPAKSAGSTTSEADGTRWFQVDVGSTSGSAIQGWARESGHPNVELCSPWAWPGFELFDVGELEPRELFARELASSGRAQPQERDQLDDAARNIERSPLFDALGKAIDADGNQEVTPLELRDALKTPWLAQALSHLVIRYPSEWSDPTDRWSRIDELIEDPALRKDWEHEKQRIKSLLIWPDVAGQHDFPPDPTVHHLHPVGFVENFNIECDGDCLKVSAGQVTFDAEGNDIPGSPFFSRVLHWPGGASGVTIGRGYDMKERSESVVTQDLIDAGVSREAAQLFAQGAGLSGSDAQNFVRRNRDTYGEISCEAQKVLFEDVTYPRYVAMAKRRYESATQDTPEAPLWNDLDAKVQDIAVDLTYQQGSVWNRQMPHITSNDRESIAQYIESTQELSQYEGGRRRAAYLRE